MYFKKMIGKKCYLSPMDLNDADQYAEWLNDYDIAQYLSVLPLVITSHSEKEILMNLSKGHQYAIITNTSNELMGSCGLMNIDQINQSAEVGIFIGNKKYLNQGYGSEALSLLVDYAFQILNIHSLMLRVYSFNERAIACYRKIGFKEMGRRREAIQRNKTRFDEIWMDILPDDFYQEKKKNRTTIE